MDDDLPDPAEVRDELPEDLDRGFVGAYMFPDNNRRRITGAIYVLAGGLILALSLGAGDDAVLANTGLTIGAGALLAIGVFSLVAVYRTKVDENEALVAASRDLGFAVGHASAQLGWRGFTSRPTWRMLVYSSEDPPTKRGMVLIDGVHGGVVEHYVEDNPEDWIETVPGAADQTESSPRTDGLDA
ncbi:MAG: hypothetical protein P8N02_14485 [Actinomycetota bacterium]|nr:hypothetical protein [Actinomycetota bacterium]